MKADTNIVKVPAAGKQPSRAKRRTTTEESPRTQSTQIPLIMNALKELFRQRGSQHKDIASALGVAERTVARWMAGTGVTLQIAEDLCRFADLTLLDLFEIINQGKADPAAFLSLRQEQEITQHPFCWFVFAHLIHGVSLTEAQQQFEIPESQIVLALIKLEKLGLLTLLPGNRVRLKVSRNTTWRKNGPVSQMRDKVFRSLLRQVDFIDGKYVAETNVTRLSAASLAYVEDKMRLLIREILELAKMDRKLGTDLPNDWYVLLCAAHKLDGTPHDFLSLGNEAAEPSSPVFNLGKRDGLRTS